MKNLLYLLITAGVMASSCAKTYQCKNEAEIITGEVHAYALSRANARCRANGSQSATLKPKNFKPAPRAVPDCETNNTGTITFINNGSGILKITVENAVPPGFDSLNPGKKVSATIKSAVIHTFTAEAVNGKGTSGKGEFVVNACEEHLFELNL
jgi:hypothetical protein